MWIEKWNKVTSGQRDYLREVFSEGKVLQFEKEEDVLRFLEILNVNAPIMENPISYSIQRFNGDRKEKYKMVKSEMIEHIANDLSIDIA